MARYAKFFSLGGGGGTNNLQLPIGTILDTTLRQVQDGLGTGSPLYLSTRRVGITSDSSVTTQTSSVIQATTTNANLVIAPNGTGALVASIPDGTATGGNARGSYAVDFQTYRTVNDQVASAIGSSILGGENNKLNTSSSIRTDSVIVAGNTNNIRGNNKFNCFIGAGSNNQMDGGASVIVGGNNNSSFANSAFVGGGDSNTANGTNSSVLGGASNNASSNYSTISGGQSNTASTNTHATVIGGQGNTSSGQWGISGGQSSTASGNRTISLGTSAVANAAGAVAISAGAGNQTTASGISSVSIGNDTVASGRNSLCTGYFSNAYLYGQKAHSGNFIGAAVQGNCQFSELNPYKLDTLNSGATTVLSLDGTGTTNLIIPSGNNRLWAVKVVATAFVSVAGGTLVLGDSYMGEFTLLFKRVGGTSSVVGVNSANLIYDTNMATAAFTFAAGASQDLQITFKAPTTASATTFRCVAKVELVEVAY